MKEISKKRAAYLLLKGLPGIFLNRVLSMSLEITHSCNCNCTHCDKGGRIPNEKLASPERFGEIIRTIKPVVAQISGGDPFLRKDLYQIAEKIKINRYYPYVVLVTNGWLLNKSRYETLKNLGVDEFCISLDFPDERHDENRGIPGLFQHLNHIIPEITRAGNKDISVISVIRSRTIADLIKLAEKAGEWGASIVFSAYTPLRTQNFNDAPTSPEQLDYLRSQLDELMKQRDKFSIITPDSVLNGYYDFFAHNCYIPDCRAGHRSLVVNPDGKLAPCAMQGYSFHTRTQLLKQFSRNNTCGGCYVSLRANSEKPLIPAVKNGLSFYALSKNGRSRGLQE
jgi:MoaA/NifB/PqqE/SkfB family radical SAM enzyme